MRLKDEKELEQYGIVIDPEDRSRAILPAPGAVPAASSPARAGPPQPGGRRRWRDRYLAFAGRVLALLVAALHTAIQILVKRIRLAVLTYEQTLDSKIRRKLNRRNRRRRY